MYIRITYICFTQENGAQAMPLDNCVIHHKPTIYTDRRKKKTEPQKQTNKKHPEMSAKNLRPNSRIVKL